MATAALLTGCTSTVAGSAVANLGLPVTGFPDKNGFAEVDSESFYLRDGNPE